MNAIPVSFMESRCQS